MYPDINGSVYTLVYRANVVLRKALQAHLRDFDITSEQWGILSRLLYKGGCSQKELSVDTYKEQAAITRTLAILEDKGLVERERSTVDRRESLVFITAAGEQLMRRTLPCAKQHEDELRAILQQEEIETLQSLLRKLCNGLQHD